LALWLLDMPLLGGSQNTNAALFFGFCEAILLLYLENQGLQSFIKTSALFHGHRCTSGNFKKPMKQ